MEAKIFTIGKVTFKQTACSHYFIKQGEKFVKVKKSEYLEALDKASYVETIGEKPCLVKFIGTIAKPIARKLVRRYAKGKTSAVKWFNECAIEFGIAPVEIKCLLKKVA